MFGIGLQENHLNLIKLFVLRQFKTVENQSALGLNRGLSSHFCWLRSANYVKLTEE